MSSENVNLLSEILTVMGAMDERHPNGIAVSQPSVLVPRSQILEVYKEGELFSGLELVGRAECCIAPTPAPHIPAYIPTQVYLDTAKQVFKNNARLLPKYENVRCVSPQVTLWWKRSGDVKPYDFTDIYKLGKDEQSDFSLSIANKCNQAVDLITRLRGKPIVWGTWGYGTSEERQKEGLTRGGPTLKEGHLHVSYFDPREQQVSVQKITSKDKLNHYAPWNNIILKKFGVILGTFIKGSFDKALVVPNIVQIKRENKIVNHPNGSASILNGYSLSFEKPSLLEDVLSSLVDMAGKFENLYGDIHELFKAYNSTVNPNVKAETFRRMNFLFRQSGASKNESQDLSRFIFSIQPTYGQLLQLGQRNKIEKYERVRKKIKSRPQKILLMDIIEDTLKEPSDESIGFTFPVHSSFCYIIKDYSERDDKIHVNSLNIYPQFATTESGPERTLGVILKRPIK